MSSSVSSFDGNSDRDSFFQKNFLEGGASTTSSTAGIPAIIAPTTTVMAAALRHPYLRKTDLLDTLDTTTNRLRDTDAWSVAATIDDQESVISAHGNPPSIITSSSRMTLDRDTDIYNEDGTGIEEDRSSVVSSIRNIRITTSHSRQSQISNTNHHNNTSAHSTNHHPPSIAGSLPSIIPNIIGDDEDKGSRSNLAEFGDDGTRSAAADFDDDHSSMTSESDSESHLHHHHHHHHLHHHRHTVVDDQIMAPPQPQPSFAATASVVSTKSYAELLEENDLLQQQMRAMRIQLKHQEEMIYHLRQLTGCNDEVYGKALHLSQIKEEDLKNIDQQLHNLGSSSTNTNGGAVVGGSGSGGAPAVGGANNGVPTADNNLLMATHSTSLDYNQMAPIVNARTLTQKLVRLAEILTRFAQSTAISEEWSLRLEQVLYLRIMDSYLTSLPFGTENQHLLNTAYSDQICRFHNTLGANFAKWYRRQTVQSLSLNPATKEYLQHMRNYVTEEMFGLVNTMLQAAAVAAVAVSASASKEDDSGSAGKDDNTPTQEEPKHDGKEEGEAGELNGTITTTTTIPRDATACLLDQNNLHMWNELLELCSALSLEIHGGDADVTAQIIAVGSKYDEEIMAPIGDDLKNTDIKNKAIKMVVSPLFVDEDEVVLLPARVVLE